LAVYLHRNALKPEKKERKKGKEEEKENIL